MTSESDLYAKVAFAPLAAGAAMLRAAPAIATAGRGAWNFAREGAKALTGFATQGPLTGAARAGRAVGTGASAANTALGLHGMVSDIVKPSPPPAPNSAATQATASKTVYSSLDDRIEKIAFGPTNALNVASYLSMIGAEVLPHEHPWHARLEALGLGGLAASTAANMIQSPDDELKPGAKDLAGLGLFASALHDRTKHAGSLDDYRRALHSDSPETILAGELADAEIARKMQGSLGRGAGGTLGVFLGAGLGGAVQESGLLGRRLPSGFGTTVGGLLGGLAGYRAGSLIPSVRSPYEDMPREEALAKIREEIAARAPSKVAFVGPGGDAALLGLPSAVGYVAGRHEPMTLDEAHAQAKAPMDLGAFAFVPGYTGYYHGVRGKAERMLAGQVQPDDTMAHAQQARERSLTPEARRAATLSGLSAGAGAGLGGYLGQRLGGAVGGTVGAGAGAGLGAWLGSHLAG